MLKLKQLRIEKYQKKRNTPPHFAIKHILKSPDEIAILISFQKSMKVKPTWKKVKPTKFPHVISEKLPNDTMSSKKKSATIKAIYPFSVLHFQESKHASKAINTYINYQIITQP
jgi:hypothetical protein